MKGGGGNTTSTVYQNKLPAYAEPYYHSLMKRGLEASEQPYQQYTGQRIADPGADTSAGYGQMRDLANSGLATLNQGTALVGNAANAAANMNYQPTHVNAQQVGPNGQVGQSTFGQAQADQYMSPYMNSVVEHQKQGAIQDWQRMNQVRNDQGVKAGAFGNNRRGVVEGMADESLGRQLGDIQASGLQNAYQNAQQAYQSDREANQGAQKFNIQTGMQGDLANQQANLQAGMSNQSADQFAAELGLRGQQTAMQGGQALGQMQGMSDQLSMDRIRGLLSTGQRQDDMSQAGLDLSYTDFINQRDSERQNLQFLSSLLNGVPMTANQNVTSTSTQGNNPLASVGAMGGLYSLFGQQ